MIGSFRNKSLRKFWEKGDRRAVSQDHQKRVRAILSVLDAAERLEDLNLPGYHLHALKQHKPLRYSMRVSGNWRVTFEWRNGTADSIDYEDYH